MCPDELENITDGRHIYTHMLGLFLGHLGLHPSDYSRCYFSLPVICFQTYSGSPKTIFHSDGNHGKDTWESETVTRRSFNLKAFFRIRIRNSISVMRMVISSSCVNDYTTTHARSTQCSSLHAISRRGSFPLRPVVPKCINAKKRSELLRMYRDYSALRRRRPRRRHRHAHSYHPLHQEAGADRCRPIALRREMSRLTTRCKEYPVSDCQRTLRRNAAFMRTIQARAWQVNVFCHKSKKLFSNTLE